MEGLKIEEIEQLASYVDNIEECELYYGNKEEFQKRHSRIKLFVKNLMLKNEKNN